MSNTPTVVVLPTIDLGTLLQPVSAMLRNCLITANPKLKEVDFTHLQMYIPVLTESETVANGQVLVKATAENRYRLESKQVFQYNRVNADEALTALGFADRIFTKAQFNDVAKLLTPVGTINVISGDINNVQGCSSRFHIWK